MSEWEVWTITTLHNENASDEDAAKREDVSLQFEELLAELIEEFQGRAGLTFKVADSEGREFQK